MLFVTRVYVFNEGIAPIIMGQTRIEGKNYEAVEPDVAEALRQSTLPVKVEGDPDFPSPFLRYGQAE